ncbi:MAG: oligosaccharide flippase family protein [Candidatus Poseidoniales archaeon]|jgi:O-antigen/teichoic acid export membrane protein
MVEGEERRPQLLRDSVWLTAADLISISAGLVGQVILTHALLSEEYGLFVVLIDAFALMFMLIDAGLPTIITRDIPRARGQARDLVHRTLKIQAILAAIFLPIGLVSGFLIWPDIPALLLICCSLIPIFHIFTYAHRSALRALGEARQEAVVKVLERLVVTSGYAILLWNGVSNPTWYALSFLSGVIISLGYAVWQGERTTLRYTGEEGEDVLLDAKQLLLSALPFAVTLGILPLLGRMEKVMLASWDTYSSAALFHVAYLAYLAGLTVPQAMRAAFLPILGDSRKESQVTLNEVRKARKLVNLLIPIGMIGGAIVVYFLFPLAFPEQYNDGSMGRTAFELFLLMLAGWAATMLAVPTYVEVCAGKRPWLFTRMLGEAAVIAVIVAVFTIPAWGVMGAVVSSISAAIALLFSSIHHSNTGFDANQGYMLTSVLCFSAAVLIVWLGVNNAVSVPISIVIGIILCLAPWMLMKPEFKISPECE